MIRRIIPETWKPRLRRIKAIQEEFLWKRTGCPVPPPRIVKQKTVREYAQLFGARSLVETGTYLGEMIDAVKSEFALIYSVELDLALYRRAANKYRNDPKIQILHGDSASLLPSILGRVKTPSLFWLDAHYSEGNTARGEKLTPIEEEIRAILDHDIKEHVILIDDAREFNGQGDYPSLETLRKTFLNERPDWVFEVTNDIIRAHPPRKQ